MSNFQIKLLLIYITLRFLFLKELKKFLYEVEENAPSAEGMIYGVEWTTVLVKSEFPQLRLPF